MVFHWSLSDSKFSQVSRTLLSILADFSQAVVWMVSICPPIYISSNSLSKPLFPSAPITFGVTYYFSWSSSDSKSPQDLRALLYILADLNNAIDWRVFSRSLISKSSSPFTHVLGTVPTAPTAIGITVMFIFHCFFFQKCPGTYLSFSFLLILPYDQPVQANTTIWRILIFLLLNISMFGLLAEIRWSSCISISQRILGIPFFRSNSGLCI